MGVRDVIRNDIEQIRFSLINFQIDLVNGVCERRSLSLSFGTPYKGYYIKRASERY